jgi:hypothetical protein
MFVKAALWGPGEVLPVGHTWSSFGFNLAHWDPTSLVPVNVFHVPIECCWSVGYGIMAKI